MDNIYDTLAKLNKVANAPEIVKEDSNALMKKGLEDLMKKTKFTAELQLLMCIHSPAFVFLS